MIENKVQTDDLWALAAGVTTDIIQSSRLSGYAPSQWLKQSPEELRERLAIPLTRARRLCSALELGRRIAVEQVSLEEPLRGGESVGRWFTPRFASCSTERFHGLYLDAKGRVLHEQCISEGTLTSSLVHPREVFAPAVAHRAAAVVVVHNHPSGDPEVSAEDRATTRRLQRVGRILGIELIDHVVVAAGGTISFLERGWM